MDTRDLLNDRISRKKLTRGRSTIILHLAQTDFIYLLPVFEILGTIPDLRVLPIFLSASRNFKPQRVSVIFFA